MASSRALFKVKFDQEPLGLIPDSLKEPVNLHPMPTWPATFHASRRRDLPTPSERPKHLRLDYVTYPQAVRNFANRLHLFFSRRRTEGPE